MKYPYSPPNYLPTDPIKIDDTTACYQVTIKMTNGRYVNHRVSKDVYTYINQLATYIKNPEKSKLLDIYKDRFKAN